jgi:pyruvate,water dikinase
MPFERVITAYGPTLRSITELIEEILETGDMSDQHAKQLERLSDAVSLDKDALLAYSNLVASHGWEKISVRTSAFSEDGAGSSFAGQYVSFVDIVPTVAGLEEYVRKCFQSLFAPRVVQYALASNLRTLHVGGSAIAQEMFYGDKSGVMFTENGHGEITIAVADSWRNDIVEGNDASITILIPKTTMQAKSTSWQIRRIAQIGLDLEGHYERPVDVEWAYTSRKVMILQVRPQTTDTTAYSLTWDGTNISENYPGITLPLTYSFIKGLYAQVYPSFFRLMGMSEKRLRNREWIFNNVLGYINGHVYYRIENWYELVRLLPGARNQAYFEAMLQPAKKRTESGGSSTLRSLLSPGLVLLAARFAWLLLRSGAYSEAFAKTFTIKLEQYNHLDWSVMSAEAILKNLQEIRRELLQLWGVPILNDVRVMVAHGIYKTVFLKDVDSETYLKHLNGLTDRASIKPLQALYQLGKRVDLAMKQEATKRLEALEDTPSWASVEAEAKAFIRQFGSRTPDELKLENARLGENIWDVLHLAYASKDANLSLVSSENTAVTKNLPVMKRLLLPYITHNVRRSIDYRERFRFNRAQVFRVARSAYLALGSRLVEGGVLDQQADIFMLTEDEVQSIVDGHSWRYDYRAEVKRRHLEYAAYDKLPFWLRTSGSGKIATTSILDTTPVRSDSDASSGDGVAPGRVTASVVVLSEFDPSIDVTDKILVVRHVDPGWTLLLVQAAGVITERGNALSHVAIVSREIGVPAIVGVKDAVITFKTGETITIDGTSGEITRES